MIKICSNSWCNQSFVVTPEDLAFYDKVSPVFLGTKFFLPTPTLCPSCREQRRLGQFNRHFMYKRLSAAGKEIISIFSPDKNRTVYENTEWWSDAWDPLSYGREPDRLKPLLPQMRSLVDDVPVMAMINDQNENSPYINSSGWSKNCHWSWGVDYCEDVFYSESTYNSTDCIDCLFLEKCQHCYECVDCVDCQSLLFSQDCRTCHTSAFLRDCTGCSNCFGCVGLRQKQYCYFNQQLEKDAYLQALEQHVLYSADSLAEVRQKFTALSLTLPHRSIRGTGNENVEGDYLYHSKNAFQCFDSYGLEDCKFCCNTRGATDCQDVSFWGHPGELLYECMAVGEAATNVLFSYLVWGGTENMIYCTLCIGCKDCFGCAGLRHKQYCIFNKQYSKDEYASVVSDLLTAMRERGEWGEFFSLEHAPFSYNESMAQVFYPLTRADVELRGWQWREPTLEVPSVPKIIQSKDLPPSIDSIPDDILHWAIACEKTKRPFRIEKKELAFYRLHKLPLPRLHPEERLWARWKQRNARKLWNRACAKCNKPIATSYSLERPEIAYCERCYLETVY